MGAGGPRVWGMRAAVITVSDRSAAGELEDRSGPRAVEMLEAKGYEPHLVVVPDGRASVAGAIRDALDAGARLVVTSGGTGVGPRDETPEGTSAVIDAELTGVAELLRSTGAEHTPFAVLSRGLAGIVVNGCIRDSRKISEIEGGVLALATHPLKSRKNGEGERGATVEFGGVTWTPGHYLYADEDGVVLADRDLYPDR